MYRTLNGSWSFCQADEGIWQEAQVPGCDFLDLMRHDLIPDPFISLNEKDVQWVGQKDWEYKRSFELTEDEFKYDEILLDAKMLDTLCDVYINEQFLFHGDNCFIPYSHAIKPLIKPGENEIRILLSFCYRLYNLTPVFSYIVSAWIGLYIIIFRHFTDCLICNTTALCHLSQIPFIFHVQLSDI